MTNRNEMSTLSNLNRLEVKSYVLNGNERIKLFASVFANSPESNIKFDWTDNSNPLSEIVSEKLIFQKGYFKANKSYGKTSFFQILSSHLTDELLRI